MNRLRLLGSWAAHPESIDQCADRLLQFFTALATCDGRLARWFKTGRSRKDALRHRVDVGSREALLAILEQGCSRTDVGKEVMYDLGYSVYLWNGRDDENGAALHVDCGSYAQYSMLPNRCTIDFPDTLGGLSDAARMQSILEATAIAWEPAWAGIISDEAMKSRTYPARPFIDWMVYIGNDWLPTVPALSAPASVKSLKSGAIIVVQNEPPDPTDSAHLENIRRVESALRAVLHVPPEIEMEADKLRRLHDPARDANGG